MVPQTATAISSLECLVFPQLSTIFNTIAFGALAVAATAVVVAAAAVAAPALLTIGGTVISTAAIASSATVVATQAFAVTAVAATAAVVSSTTEKKKQQSYSVYFLEDQGGTIQYVGRVTDRGYDARMNYHYVIRNLTPAHRISNLSYAEARGLEEIGMIEHHTLNALNPVNNQIHGISSRNPNGERYMEAACNYLFNRAENYVLNLFE